MYRIKVVYGRFRENVPTGQGWTRNHLGGIILKITLNIYNIVDGKLHHRPNEKKNFYL